MDYLVSTRSFSGGAFTTNPGVTRFFGFNGNTASEFTADQWASAVLQAAGSNEVAIYVHGFNLNHNEARAQFMLFRSQLRTAGFGGEVVGFDWPADGNALSYKRDRRDAQEVAPRLVLEVIGALRSVNPQVKLHIAAHSMGALVTRHAFQRAAVLGANPNSLGVDQVVLFAADIAAKSMKQGAKKTRELYRFSKRVTNYFSRADEVLTISNWIVRLGQAQRLGFDGLPEPRPTPSPDVYCQRFYIDHKPSYPQGPGVSHSWYFHEPRFFQDVRLVLAGTPAANMIGNTRANTDLGNQALV